MTFNIGNRYPPGVGETAVLLLGERGGVTSIEVSVTRLGPAFYRIIDTRDGMLEYETAACDWQIALLLGRMIALTCAHDVGYITIEEMATPSIVRKRMMDGSGEN